MKRIISALIALLLTVSASASLVYAQGNTAINIPLADNADIFDRYDSLQKLGIKNTPLFQNIKLPTSEDSYYQEFIEQKEDIDRLKVLAEHGDIEAQYSLGKELLISDKAEGLKWLHKAAEHGKLGAQHHLAIIYGNDGNSEEGLKWLHKAAEQGSMIAQSDLGHRYYDGDGVVQNFSEAAKWLRMSAEKGWRESQFNMGVLYATGRGVKKDLLIAYAWLNIASSQGYDDAKSKRDLILKAMTPEQIAKAQELSQEYYKKYVEPFKE